MNAKIERRRAGGWRTIAAAWLTVVLVALQTAQGASNLVTNGSFDDPANNLAAWRYRYDRPGESWYFENHTFVSVVDNDNGRSKVLRLHGTDAVLNVPGQGVQVDSKPIPATLKGTYRFSAWARGTGPGCRMLVEGYKWRKEIAPHPDPDIWELRKCYRFSQIYFGKQVSGEIASVGATWQKGTTVLGEEKPSPLAKDKLAEIQFLVVHIVAIAGSAGDLFVDDVRLEKGR